MAGVGNVDLRKKTNYLLVDNSESNEYLLHCCILLLFSLIIYLQAIMELPPEDRKGLRHVPILFSTF